VLVATVALLAHASVTVAAGPFTATTTAQLMADVSGASANQVINLAPGVTFSPTAPLDVKVSGMQIIGPHTGSGVVINGGLVVNSSGSGLGTNDPFEIEAGASLTLSNVSIRQTGTGGSGIDVLGSLDLENSDLQGNNNNAITSEQFSTVVIRNSTIAVNGNAGLDVIGDVQLFNDTVTGNTHGGIFMDGGTAELTNTIVAGNRGGDCPNGVVTSSVTSLDKDGTCGVNLTGNPNLGPIGFNGGTTQSYLPAAPSPAINAGTNANSLCPSVDQEYDARSDGKCDIGSMEVQGGDTTPPVVTPPANQTAEATSSAGAVVSYPNATAVDNVDGPLTPTCLPASGTTFALGVTTVTCSATDAAHNTGTATFTVTVHDTTPPQITGTPADVTVEATSSSGAAVSYTKPTATDLVDGAVTVSCAPASGSTFALGTTTVTCTATDAHSNTVTSTFHVTVQDTTKPQITVPADITAEATGASGAPVGYTVTFTDAVGVTSSGCTPASGSTFGIGTTTVNCSAMDAAGNSASASFHVKVQDTTAPQITVPADITMEATGPSGAAVGYTVTFTDAVGVTSSGCTPASGSTFGIGTTTVNCSAMDAAGNTASASFHVKVQDTTAPQITVPADITVQATGPSGAAVGYTVTFTDAVGVTTSACVPASGSTFAIGTTTVNCSASDAAGNSSSKSFQVTVQPAGSGTIHVSSTTGLQSAVASASNGDVIDVAGGTYAPTSPLDVTATNVTIQRDSGTTGNVIIVGNNVSNSGTGLGGDDVFEVEPSASATIADVSVRQTPTTGSAIDVQGTLDLESSDLQGNNSNGLTAEQGSNVTVQNSTIALSSSAGIDAVGRVHLFNSTVAHNLHGGVFVETGGTVSAVNSIIGKNSGHDCPNGAVTSQSHSLDSDGTCGVWITADPHLGTLGLNGGVTMSYPLLANSPAIDHGANLTCPTDDQTGAARNNGTATNPNCDIGSFEYVDTTNPVITVPSDITVNPTSSLGANVSYSVSASDDTAIATLACLPASGAKFPVGSTEVDCSATDTHGNTATASFHVNVRMPQTVTFTLPWLASPPTAPLPTLATQTETIVPTSTSGLPVTVTSLTPTICTTGGTNGTVVSLITAGTCELAGDQAGDATWAPAKEAVKSFTVTYTKQTIVFNPVPPTTGFVGDTITLSATTQSSSDVTFSTSSDPSICTVSGNVVTLTGAGSCKVLANAASDGNYSAALTVTKSITVKQLAQTISWTPASTTLSVAGGPVTLDATASSGLSVTYSTTAAPAICTVSGNVVTPVGPGSCAVKASQAGNTQYAVAVAVSKTFKIVTP
jgi:hypothetical protein